MNESLREYLKTIGAEKVDAETLKEYRQGMEKDVIPRIVHDIQERQRLVAAARYRRATAPVPTDELDED